MKMLKRLWEKKKKKAKSAKNSVYDAKIVNQNSAYPT